MFRKTGATRTFLWPIPAGSTRGDEWGTQADEDGFAGFPESGGGVG